MLLDLIFPMVIMRFIASHMKWSERQVLKRATVLASWQIYKVQKFGLEDLHLVQSNLKLAKLSQLQRAMFPEM
jgi:hypothetical protein